MSNAFQVLMDFPGEGSAHQFVGRGLVRWLSLLRWHMNSLKNMDLMKLMEGCETQNECRAILEELRWPNGVCCPSCGSEKISRIRKRFQYDCDSCRYQFSVTSGTMFHDSHLPLPKWFAATYLLCESKKGMSALQLKRTLHTGYQTAWYLCHRIRAAMMEVAPKKLSGTVEIDETYVGGKKRRWRPRSVKQVVIGIKQRNGDLRLIRAEDAKAATVREIIKANVGSHVEVIMTDESTIYPWALDKMQKNLHKTINHTYSYAHGNVHTNTVESAFSLLKRGIVGTWHKISTKHLPAYLDEMCFRFNNRKNPYLFRDVLTKLIQTPHVEYKDLTAKIQDAA